MKNSDGILSTDREEITDICAKFYQDLYASQKHLDEPTDSNCTDDVPPFLNAEIESALNKIKKYKAPGLDYVTSGIIKVAGHDTLRNIPNSEGVEGR